MSLTSTVPGAIAALQDKMLAVKAALPDLKLGVYVGQIVGDSVVDNFFAIGSPVGEGELVMNYLQEISDLDGSGRSESYEIVFSVRAWSEGVDELARLNDAFTLISALTTELADDPHAGDALYGGVWTVGQVENPIAGKIGGRGWGIVLASTVKVTDVYLVEA